MHDLDLVINEGDIRSGALQLLRYVRPEWNEDKVHLTTFTDGITNQLVGCWSASGPADDIVLVRVFGKNTELLIDRQAEVANFKRLAVVKCAPPLYATFRNGLCYGYVKGTTLDERTVRDDTVRRLVAGMFVRFHQLEQEEGQRSALLFPTLKRYLSLISPGHKTLIQERVPPHETLSSEVQRLEKHLTTLNSPVVFCHNDALLKNIIYDSDHGRVTFIDYEYAGFNYQAFDIGNHFCEFAGVVGTDFSRYPDRSFQLEWLRTYLELWNEAQGLNREVSDHQVQTLYVQVNKFALASHFMWGLWGLIQAENSTIDFDFAGFAIARFNEYFARKDEFLALMMPEAPSGS